MEQIQKDGHDPLLLIQTQQLQILSRNRHPNPSYIFLPKTVSFFGTQKTSRLQQIYGMIKASGTFISVIEWPRILAPDS